jgi:hypothetical protein
MISLKGHALCSTFIIAMRGTIGSPHARRQFAVGLRQFDDVCAASRTVTSLRPLGSMIGSKNR